MHTTQCQPTFGHLGRSVFGSSTSGAARSGGAVRRTARPGDGSRSWRMTFSPGPASFIRGPKSASPSNTRGGSRVPEWGALSNERPYRDLRNVVTNYPVESSIDFRESSSAGFGWWRRHVAPARLRGVLACPSANVGEPPRRRLHAKWWEDSNSGIGPHRPC